MSAWVLPDHLSDVLPSEARHIEELRRQLLDTARSYGYELVMPPLLEHLESLLTGTGEALDLQTFKLVDQLSGRTLGLRADTTPQVARIDAHLLGRSGVTRLAYCGPVAHTRPERAHASREPLQLGAELYGHAGREADLEVLQLALDCLRAAPVAGLTVDLADARIPRALLAGLPLPPEQLHAIHAALAAKDASELAALSADLPDSRRQALLALVQMYGGPEVLDEAEKALCGTYPLKDVLLNLKWLADRVQGAAVSFDLADSRGYAYYSGARFAIYAQGWADQGTNAGADTGAPALAAAHGSKKPAATASGGIATTVARGIAVDALVRGGRYDGVGAVFGHKLERDRPAVGFSLDLKQLVRVAAPRPRQAAIRAPWGDAPGLHAAIAALRAQGETVVCVLPGHEGQMDEFHCDRALVEASGQWVTQAIQ